MAEEHSPTPAPHRSPRKGTRLRAAGLVVLLLGVGGAGVRLWTSSPPGDLSAGLPTAETSKKVARDIEINFGKMGLLTNNAANDLHDPATQAIIIAAVSILVAAGCFYVAHLQDRAQESENPAA